MRYEDFILRIGCDRGNGYEVRVESLAGEGKGRLSRSLLTTIPQGFEPRPDSRRLIPPEPFGPPGPTAQEIGTTLFRAVFRGEVLALYAESRGRLASPESGLRILLKFDPTIPDAHRLQHLPWELLCDPQTRDFLSLCRTCSVVRYLELARPRGSVVLPPKLRILVVTSSPREFPPLDLDRECKNLEAAWEDHSGVDVVFLKEARLPAVREAMLETSFHVLHYMGHGDFDLQRNEGQLILEGEDGLADRVSGEAFATQLKDIETLRLIVLNACHTAQVPHGNEVSLSNIDGRAADFNPFAGVASALVLGGVSAVLAMQKPISDQAAIAFSKAFYRRLAAGDPVDGAVAESRLAIHANDPTRTEWATPILFLRARDGSLFEPEADEASAVDLALPSRTAADSSRFRRLVSALLLLLLIISLTGYVLRQEGAPDLYRVRVTVLDLQGHPTEGTEVGASVGGEPQQVAGGWEIEIAAANRPPDGRIEIWARKGFLNGKTDVELADSPVLTVQLRLSKPPPADVRGTVVDALQRGIAGARVSLSGYADEAVITTENGSFVLPAHAGYGEELRLHVEHPDFPAWDQYHLVGEIPAFIVLQKP